MKNAANFRDLGGIRTADGKKVKHGMLFRSGKLKGNPEKISRRLREHNITDVVDLRSPSELIDKPEVIPDMNYHSIPPLNDEQNPSVNSKNRRSILMNILRKDGGAKRHLEDIYRIMVSSPMAVDALRELIDLLKDDKGEGVLWHCTQGKDRTGISTAAVLMVLGVNRDNIMRDYLRSNRYYRLKNYLIFLGVTLVTLSEPTAHSLHLLLSARKTYLSSAFDEIDRRWGGTDGFIHNALGLSDTDIEKLRAVYLE